MGYNLRAQCLHTLMVIGVGVEGATTSDAVTVMVNNAVNHLVGASAALQFITSATILLRERQFHDGVERVTLAGGDRDVQLAN